MKLHKKQIKQLKRTKRVAGKKKHYKYSISDMHELIALSAALNYELQKAEDIRKRICKLRLKKLQ